VTDRRLRIRPAAACEAQALSALCLRSKAHWGYDPDFLRRCERTLRVEPEACGRGDVLVAAGAEHPIGVAAIRMPERDRPAMLELLFVEPGAIGRGVGGTLFAAIVALLGGRGIAAFEIASDPYAAPFYERMGARRIGETPSDALPGRMLPLYRFTAP
jgi:GNAT superfamily N-acetyltransferase